MAKANVFNMAGQQVGEIELSDAVFGIEPNTAVVHEVVKNHLANCRQGTQSALTRARSRRRQEALAPEGHRPRPSGFHPGSPVDPRRHRVCPKPRTYRYTLNKKVKRLALKSALSAKAASGDILVVDGLKLDEVKTKAMKGFLDSIQAGKSVVITPEVEKNVVLSARNIPGVITTTAKVLSVYDIVNATAWWSIRPPWLIIEEVFA